MYPFISATDNILSDVEGSPVAGSDNFARYYPTLPMIYESRDGHANFIRPGKKPFVCKLGRYVSNLKASNGKNVG